MPIEMNFIRFAGRLLVSSHSELSTMQDRAMAAAEPTLHCTRTKSNCPAS